VYRVRSCVLRCICASVVAC